MLDHYRDPIARLKAREGALLRAASKKPTKKQKAPEDKVRSADARQAALNVRYGGEPRWSRPTEYRGVVFDSTWEAAFAQRCDALSVKWVRPDLGFPYYWKGRPHKYYPDFYLPDYNLYVETKGYYSGVDFAKFTQFPHPLIVIYSLITIQSWTPPQRHR